MYKEQDDAKQQASERERERKKKKQRILKESQREGDRSDLQTIVLNLMILPMYRLVQLMGGALWWKHHLGSLLKDLSHVGGTGRPPARMSDPPTQASGHKF